ncbi:peptidase C39 [Pseudoduganella lutea]|uniref:Peptidase C39 n=2 Tax=Pseudoduganella lutea TaxID=321985 RepID=A0A4P6L7X9_9BURK|nr:peptidase C39 [Pseudoduganella lutea]
MLSSMLRSLWLGSLLSLPVLVPAADLPIAGGGPVSMRVTSLKEARYLSTVRQQYDFSCGSAALATLLTHHYGYPVGEQQAFAQMFAGGDQRRIRQEGFSLLDMKRFLAAHGFTADGFQQPLDNLAKAGLPAIVLVAEHGYRHFVVVKGMRDGRVLFGDPSGGTRALSRAAFEAIWLNQLLFVIHDRPGKARFNERSDWAAAPRLPPGDALQRDSLQRVTLPKFDAGDF